MNKAIFVVLTILFFLAPSQTQDMILEEDGESLIIVNWEEFLEDFPDNPIIEPIILPSEEENEEDNIDVPIEFETSEEIAWENELGEESQWGEETQLEEIEVEEVELIVYVTTE